MDAAKLMGLMKDKKASMQKRDKTAKPQPGKNRIVLLPGWREEERHLWFHDFGQHFIKNAAKEIQAVYPCLDATFGKPCPICDGLAKASRMVADDETQNLLGEAKASRTVLINALLLDSDNPNTPQILEIKRSVFGQLVETVEEWGVEAFSREITITREGKGLNTKYTVGITPKKFEVPASILSKLHNLDEYVKQESEEQQRRAISAINNVAGLLSAPSAADKPRTAAKFDDDDDILREAEMAASARTSSPAATTTGGATLDDELDDLLA